MSCLDMERENTENVIKMHAEVGKNGHSPYIDEITGTWFVFDDVSRKYIDTNIKARGANSWEDIDGKPESFPPSEHNHDDRYYTSQDVDMQIQNLANALKSSKSGSAILIDDISPVAHEMEVKVRGKNLIPYPYYETTKTQNGVTFIDNGDGSITVNGTATADTLFFLCSASNYTIYKGTYTLSGCPNGGSNTTYAQVLGSSYFMDKGNGITRNYSEDIKLNVFIKIFSGYTADNLVFKPQLELGTTATAYTPYATDLTAVKVIKSNASGEDVAEYTPTADGTVDGVTSLYPNTTLTIDTDGVIIDCEYNRDINKAFTENITGITVNGTELPVEDKKVALPIGSTTNFGLVKGAAGHGINVLRGEMRINAATNGNIDARTANKPINTINLNYAVTAALTDAKHIVLTSEQQATAKEVLGIGTSEPTGTFELIETIDGSTLGVSNVTIKRDKEPNGTAYSFSKTIVVVKCASENVTVEAPELTVYFERNGVGEQLDVSAIEDNGGGPANNDFYTTVLADVCGGLLHLYSYQYVNFQTFDTFEAKNVRGYKGCMGSIVSPNYITGLTVHGSGLYESSIEIYGVRA